MTEKLQTKEKEETKDLLNKTFEELQTLIGNLNSELQKLQEMFLDTE